MPARALAVINFVRSETPTTVSQPSFIATLDLNRDERDDVAVLSTRSSEITVLVSSGVAELTSGVVYSFGRQLSHLAAGDLNGDEIPDLVVTDMRQSRVYYLLAEPNGVFAPPRHFNIGRGTFATAIGDFDKRNGNDLAVADRNENVVYVVLNDGGDTPAFGSATPFAVGQGPEDILTVDMNNDGNLDLVTLNSGGARVKDVSVLLFDRLIGGLPAFTAVANFGVGEDPSDMVAADLDHDGNIDLAMLNRRLGAPNGEVILLWGIGNGVVNRGAPLAIQCPVFISTRVGCVARALRAVDLDDDGDLDLALTQDDPREGDVTDLLTVLLGNNDRNFLPGPVFRTNTSPTHMAVGSFAGDPLPDIVIASQRPSLVQVFRNVPSNEGSDLVNGQVCQDPDQCLSTFCVDGVCCQDECDDDERCDLSGSEGRCADVDENRPRGAACDSGDQCQSGFCVDDVCCVGGACPQNGRCDIPGSEGICRAVLANGTACEREEHCASEHCIDSFCCNETCGDGRCNVPGSEGRCVSLTPTSTPTPRPQPPTPTATRDAQTFTCDGDCNDDGNVSVDELVKGVNIALDVAPVSTCTAFDTNEDGQVSVAEIVAAVNAALGGCDGP